MSDLELYVTIALNFFLIHFLFHIHKITRKWVFPMINREILV